MAPCSSQQQLLLQQLRCRLGHGQCATSRDLSLTYGVRWFIMVTQLVSQPTEAVPAQLQAVRLGRMSVRRL